MNTWQLIGILSIYMLATCLLVLVLRWPLGIHHTFSRHASQSVRLSVYYMLVFSITMPLLLLSFVYWVVPSHTLTNWITYLLGVSIITQIICTFFPESNSDRQRSFIHRVFAGISATLLAPTLIIITVSVDGVLQIITLFGLLIMTIALSAAVLLRGKYALLLQACYYAGFFIPIVALLIT